MALDDATHFECTKKEKQTWKKAAEKDNRSMSAWIRLTLNKAAQDQLKDKKSSQ